MPPGKSPAKGRPKPTAEGPTPKKEKKKHIKEAKPKANAADQPPAPAKKPIKIKKDREPISTKAGAKPRAPAAAAVPVPEVSGSDSDSETSSRSGNSGSDSDNESEDELPPPPPPTPPQKSKKPRGEKAKNQEASTPDKDVVNLLLGKIDQRAHRGKSNEDTGATRSLLFQGLTATAHGTNAPGGENEPKTASVTVIGARMFPPQATAASNEVCVPIVGHLYLSDKETGSGEGQDFRPVTIYAKMATDIARQIYESTASKMDPCVPVIVSNLQRKTKPGLFSLGLLVETGFCFDGSSDEFGNVNHVYETKRDGHSQFKLDVKHPLAKSKDGMCKVLAKSRPYTLLATRLSQNEFTKLETGALFSIDGVFLEGDGWTHQITAKQTGMWTATLTVFDSNCKEGWYAIPISAFMDKSPDSGPAIGAKSADFQCVTLYNLKKTYWKQNNYHSAVIIERSVFAPSMDPTQENKDQCESLRCQKFASIIDGLAGLADQLDAKQAFIAPFYVHMQSGAPIFGYCYECKSEIDISADTPRNTGKCEWGHAITMRYRVHLECKVNWTKDGKTKSQMVPVQMEHQAAHKFFGLGTDKFLRKTLAEQAALCKGLLAIERQGRFYTKVFNGDRVIVLQRVLGS